MDMVGGYKKAVYEHPANAAVVFARARFLLCIR